eukprot:TRINITY_DN1579_c0_g1_i2.p1 TRINITY_DN1579_c0_g1~~TRINITY_DN1579_c0_g1_i2.p1  ORF type:complete len:319 (-),score=38.40 TRINITY_DN1579_c0_g1_i2:23-979(-)
MKEKPARLEPSLIVMVFLVYQTQLTPVTNPKMIKWQPLDTKDELSDILKAIKNPRPDSWISDGGNLLSESEHILIDSFIQSMFDNIGVEVAVITIKEVPSSMKGGLELATFICQHWQIGYYSTGKGMVILAVEADDTISVVPAKGLLSFFDPEFTAEVNRTRGKEESWSSAISEVLQACEDKIEGIHRLPKTVTSRPPEMPSIPLFLIIVMFISFASYLYYKKRQLTRCAKCGSPAQVGQAQPEQLNAGEEYERALKSVRHFSKSCTNPECNHTEVIRSATKQFAACDTCGYHTKNKSGRADAPCAYCSPNAVVVATE